MLPRTLSFARIDATRRVACLLLVGWPLAGLGFLRGAEPTREPTREPPPNFVIISCDNLGYGDIEPFGSPVHRTPHLTRMAREGRRLTHFYVSAGVCTPSRASLLTGCYAQRLGLHDNPRDGRVLRPLSPYGLHPDEVTIAEVLGDAGYATGITGKWHLGDQPIFLPTRQGFDAFFGIPYSDDMTAAVGQRLGDRYQGSQWPPLPLMRGESVIEAPTDRNQLTRRCTEWALEFMETHRERPFLLYFAQPMPGSTRAPFASPKFQGQSKNGPWGDAIEEIDWSTGQVLDKLVDLGLDRRTLVLWTSDNGAPLARDVEQLSRGSNRPLHGRGYTTSEGAFRAPTIVWWPGRIPAGTTSAALATTMDLLPTFAGLAGGQIPQRKIDGHDIRELLEGDGRSPTNVFYYYEGQQLQAVRSGPWKLFLPLNEFRQHPHFRKGESRHPLLFHLLKDVGCTINRAAEHPDVVAELLQLAASAREELGDLQRRGSGQRPVGRIAGKPQPLERNRATD